MTTACHYVLRGLFSFWRAKKLYQTLDLLFTATRAHAGISLFPDFFYRGCAIENGVDNIHLHHIVTGAQVFIQFLPENTGEFFKRICGCVDFQSAGIITIKDVSE